MMNNLKIEGRGVKDWPATLQEAEAASLETAMPMTHNGRAFETVGQSLARKMGEAPPDPLPGEEIDRLAVAASDIATAATLGRIFLHCVAVAQTESGGLNV